MIQHVIHCLILTILSRVSANRYDVSDILCHNTINTSDAHVGRISIQFRNNNKHRLIQGIEPTVMDYERSDSTTSDRRRLDEPMFTSTDYSNLANLISASSTKVSSAKASLDDDYKPIAPSGTSISPSPSPSTDIDTRVGVDGMNTYPKATSMMTNSSPSVKMTRRMSKREKGMMPSNITNAPARIGKGMMSSNITNAPARMGKGMSPTLNMTSSKKKGRMRKMKPMKQSQKRMRMRMNMQTSDPTSNPTTIPTISPTRLSSTTSIPTVTISPTISWLPTAATTPLPSKAMLSNVPTIKPTTFPRGMVPTKTPLPIKKTSNLPTGSPIAATTRGPTAVPPTSVTNVPVATASPTKSPVSILTAVPTINQTRKPTDFSTTKVPTKIPTANTSAPITTKTPTRLPTTKVPTKIPTANTSAPVTTKTPTRLPTTKVTKKPTKAPLVSISPTLSPGTLITATPYTVLYTPAISGATPAQIAAAGTVTCNRIDTFIRNFFTSTAGFVTVNTINCTAIASGFNPTTISYNFTMTVGSDSSPIPVQTDINRLINLVFLAPEDAVLIAQLRALSGNPYSATTGVAYSVTTRSVFDIGLDTYIIRDTTYDNQEQRIKSKENTINNTNPIRQLSIWNIGLGLLFGVVFGYCIAACVRAIRGGGHSNNEKLKQSRLHHSINKPKENLDYEVIHNLEYYS